MTTIGSPPTRLLMHRYPIPASAGRYRLLLLLFFLVATTGCRVSWTAAYEAGIDRLVAAAI